MKYIVSVKPKLKKFYSILNEINLITSQKIKDLKISKLYYFEGDIDKATLNLITKEVLVDPIVENYKIVHTFKAQTGINLINVWYKPAVLDVVALAVEKAIKYLDIQKNIKVSTGFQVIISPKTNKKFLSEIAEKIFVNTLIQQYEII
ncbi:MAG: phosphoribosylformylglycinamidine synthase subunit PurS [Endomicrobia bacterium]|nr:phosphoribosylformylglycinamidine synthase subunit PurS [Endomicrobiia bacterium]